MRPLLVPRISPTDEQQPARHRQQGNRPPHETVRGGPAERATRYPFMDLVARIRAPRPIGSARRKMVGAADSTAMLVVLTGQVGQPGDGWLSSAGGVGGWLLSAKPAWGSWGPGRRRGCGG